MKPMPLALTLGVLASLALAPLSSAAVTCPNRVPAAITAPSSDGGRACQNAIAKAAMSYVKTQLKTDLGCMSKQTPGVCPSTKDTEKKQKAALKSRDSVVKACGGGELADLTSSYSGVADPGTVASCTLSQNNVEGTVLAGVLNGTPGKVLPNKDRDKCVKTINKSGLKYALGIQKSINKCLATQIKNGAAGDLTAVCVGHWNAGAFVAPTDIKTADSLSGQLEKAQASIDKACTINPVLIESIYACPGSGSVDDLKTCVACESWDATLDLLAAQYSETGTFVANGPGALQSAIDASAANAKLLLGSGTYMEEVSITSNTHDGTQIVGCGGASGDRPNLKRPAGPTHLNGIFAANIDGLLFQSLDVSGGWDENGIFVTGADGISFRDVHTFGGDGSATCFGGGNDGAACTTNGDCPSGVCTDAVSTYGIFPVQSHNVLVEASSANDIRDAGIYVGQCVDMTVRYNTAIGNVAGMEIENSSNAKVHNNYSSGNVGGLLTFKLPGPEVQRGDGHEIFDNVVIANNTTPNYGIPGTSVAGIPPGTGLVVLSVKNCDFHHNIVQNNNSYGFAIIDKKAFDALAGGALGGEYSHRCAAPDPTDKKCDPDNAAVDCPLSSSCIQDQQLLDNKFHDNLVELNGLDPAAGTVGDSRQLTYAVFEENPGPTYNNNCFEGNGVAEEALFGHTLNNCP